MTDLSLSQVFAAATAEADQLIYPAPAHWKQGRTAFGGFTSAVLLDTTLRQSPGLPPLRSALVNFTAPVTEAPRLTSSILRQGRNITTITAHAESAGATAATASFTFGHSQPSSIAEDFPGPDDPEPEDLPPFIPFGPKLPPIAFLDNFEVKIAHGQPPFSAAAEGVVRVWARHRDPELHQDMRGLIAIADLLPPAVFPMLPGPGFNSSVNWLINFLAETPKTRDGWWLLENRLTAAGGGYSSQSMRLWNAERQLITDGMQSVIVFEK